MIEPQRPILLPPPESAAPSGRTRASGLAPWAPAQPVLPVARVPGTTAEDAGDAGSWSRHPRIEDEEIGDGATATLGRRGPTRAAGAIAGPTAGIRIVDATAQRPAPLGSLAFLAQQIFQETMTSGLHLEPWTEGIGAYRRAGAAPPLEDGSAALFSVAV
jgi:hypothetical protein